MCFMLRARQAAMQAAMTSSNSQDIIDCSVSTGRCDSTTQPSSAPDPPSTRASSRADQEEDLLVALDICTVGWMNNVIEAVGSEDDADISIEWEDDLEMETSGADPERPAALELCGFDDGSSVASVEPRDDDLDEELHMFTLADMFAHSAVQQAFEMEMERQEQILSCGQCNSATFPLTNLVTDDFSSGVADVPQSNKTIVEDDEDVIAELQVATDKEAHVGGSMQPGEDLDIDLLEAEVSTLVTANQVDVVDADIERTVLQELALSEHALVEASQHAAETSRPKSIAKTPTKTLQRVATAPSVGAPSSEPSREASSPSLDSRAGLTSPVSTLAGRGAAAARGLRQQGAQATKGVNVSPADRLRRSQRAAASQILRRVPVFQRLDTPGDSGCESDCTAPRRGKKSSLLESYDALGAHFYCMDTVGKELSPSKERVSAMAVDLGFASTDRGSLARSPSEGVLATKYRQTFQSSNSGVKFDWCTLPALKTKPRINSEWSLQSSTPMRSWSSSQLSVAF
eukprot:TRINITY_DN5179_c0_g1_i2.p1 TRINITY_DN5179_c0_g1~~TRINITY_DN5179_c0_g1_i2.p1  ORF type:complete len:516 (+),score=114.69 TRINITY_DN5179_c0_g1_i2:92-1639(+)